MYVTCKRWRLILKTYILYITAEIKMHFNKTPAFCNAEQRAKLFTTPLVVGLEALTKTRRESLNLKGVCK